MANKISKKEAKEAVEARAIECGFVRDESWKQTENWNPNIARELREGLAALSRKAGHSVKTHVTSRNRQ
jgi:hypothetical protein